MNTLKLSQIGIKFTTDATNNKDAVKALEEACKQVGIQMVGIPYAELVDENGYEIKQTDFADYEVNMHVEGNYNVTVRAKSWDEAKLKAVKSWENADFGPLQDIDAEVINATNLSTDELHNYV